MRICVYVYVCVCAVRYVLVHICVCVRMRMHRAGHHACAFEEAGGGHEVSRSVTFLSLPLRRSFTHIGTRLIASKPQHSSSLCPHPSVLGLQV